MKHVKHPAQNTTVMPPPRLGGLPVMYALQGKVRGGLKAFVTRWKPSSDELAMLLAGGEVELTCLGGQPCCNVAAVPANELAAPRIVLPH